MQIESIVINAFITIFSLGLLSVSLASYRKYRNVKLFFVSMVFLVFFIKAVLLSLILFYGLIEPFSTVLHNCFFDLIILVLLFIATLKR